MAKSLTTVISSLLKLGKTKKNSTGFMVAFLSASNLISNVLTIVSGLLVARWVLPEQLGTFSIFTIISGYLVLIQLGIPSALGRELPFYLGRGDLSSAYAMASVSQYWQKFVGLIALVSGALTAIVLVTIGEFQYAMGAFTVGVTGWQVLYVTKYLKVLYRTNQEFNKLAVIKIISAVVVFGSVVFVWKFGFYGLCLRAISAALVDFILTYYWRPIRVKASWDRTHFKHLIRIGLPMFSVANVYGLWPLVQRTVIVSLGGPKALGLFTLAFMAESAMVTVSSAINNVVYPQMSMLWGKGMTVGEIIRTVAKPIFFSIALMAICLPLGWWLLPIFVNNLLPNYAGGIQAAQWMLIVGCIEPISAFSNIYNVTRNQRDRLIVYLSGIAAWAAVVWIAYQTVGFSLLVFPVAMVLSFVVMSAINFFHVKTIWFRTAQQS